MIHFIYVFLITCYIFLYNPSLLSPNGGCHVFLIAEMNRHLTECWLACWLRWLVGLLAGWLACWLRWLAGWLAELAGWLAGCAGWLAELAGWLAARGFIWAVLGPFIWALLGPFIWALLGPFIWALGPGPFV